MNQRWLGVLASIGIPLGVLMIGVRRVYPFIADDALISLRYSDRWLAGKGLTWDDYDAVEGYSNLSWVVLCAVFGALGFDLIDAVRILGVVCTVALFVAVTRFATRDGGSPMGALAANTLLALVGTIYVWAIGGLETPLVAASLAFGWLWTDALMQDRLGASRGLPWAAGAAWAVLVLTRPDGPLFVAISGLALLWHHRGLGLRAVQWGAPVVALPLGAWLGQLAFRLVYYRDWIPNPAHMKAEVNARRIAQGVEYLGEIGLGYLPVLLVGAVAFVAWRAERLRTTGVVVGVSIVAWGLYVGSVGGDIFPAHRHGVPIVVGLGFFVVLAYDAVSKDLRGQVGFGVLTALAGAALAWGQPQLVANERAVKERWEWDAAVTGRFFGEAFADEQPLVAVTAAGAIPYFSKLPALDMFGLNDRHVAQTPSQGDRIGHDRGDGEYLLAREPDLLVFGIIGTYRPPGTYRPVLGNGQRLKASYEPIKVRGRDPWPVTADVWARRYGRVGIREDDEAIVVPGYFFVGTTAELGPDGGAIGRFPYYGRAGKLALALPKGTWRATWPDEVGVTVAGAPGRVEGRQTVIVGPAKVQVAVSPVVGTAIPSIRFERTTDVETLETTLSLAPSVEVGPAIAEIPFGLNTHRQKGTFDVVSDPVVVPPDGVLRFRLRGRSDPHRYRVEVLDERGRIALTFVAEDGHEPEYFERLSGLDGQRIRFRVIDEDPRPRYRISFDEVRLHRLVPRAVAQAMEE